VEVSVEVIVLVTVGVLVMFFVTVTLRWPFFVGVTVGVIVLVNPPTLVGVMVGVTVEVGPEFPPGESEGDDLLQPTTNATANNMTTERLPISFFTFISPLTCWNFISTHGSQARG